MSSDIERALVEAETWQSIQAQPYDGERYPCGCHPHPKSPHIHFRLCDYHDGFDEGVYQGQRKLLDEVERLRAAFALAVGEVSTYGPYLYTSPEQLMEYFMQEARRERP